MKKEQLAELLNAVLMMGNHLRGQSVAGLRAKEGAKALERNVERVSESTQERTKT